MAQVSGPFGSLFEELQAGRITRRQFLNRAIGLGVAAPVALFVMNTLPGGVQDASAQAAAKAPDSGTEGQTRGAGGELKLLQWQSVSTINNHRSSGTKDTLAASLVSEPLINFLPDGTMLPTLVSEIPTLDNGGLTADLLTVTFTLKEGIVWSDGQPFTADDVVYSLNRIKDPATKSPLGGQVAIVDRVEGRAGGVEHVFGMSPRYEDLNWNGLDFGAADYATITSIDRAAWQKEFDLHAELFEKLAARLPKALSLTKAELEKRLAA